MMAPDHAQMGAIAGLVTLPVAPVESAVAHVVWVIAWIGFSLIPDWDAPGGGGRGGSAAAQMWGPVTELAAQIINQVAGGHRMGTHDLVLSPLAAFGIFSLLAHAGDLGQMTAIALAVGLSIRGLLALELGRAGVMTNFAVSWGSAWLVVQMGYEAWFSWLAFVAAGGVIVHCLGDLPTPSGLPVPVLWILGCDRRLALGWFTTGKAFETWVVTPSLGIIFVILFAWRTGITSMGELSSGMDVLAREVAQGAWPLAKEAGGVLGPVARELLRMGMSGGA